MATFVSADIDFKNICKLGRQKPGRLLVSLRKPLPDASRTVSGEVLKIIAVKRMDVHLLPHFTLEVNQFFRIFECKPIILLHISSPTPYEKVPSHAIK
jgi:hypothetical protein